MEAQPAASRASLRRLDWFTFFLADIQTGFGPFVAVFLTARAWSQVDIGLVLTIGGLVSMAVQIPAGVLVDAVRSRRLLASFAVTAISVSALAIAVWPVFPIVVGARILHAAASAILGPIIAALSLALVSHGALGERLGRNARFASIGSGVAAAAMGLTGYLISNQAVFYLTGLLAAPALLALAGIHTIESGRLSSPRRRTEGARRARVGLSNLIGNRLLVSFAGCVLLFHLANAAMLPSMAALLTPRCGGWATSVVAAAMIVPQLVVAAFSPWIGRQSQTWGRRPPLLAGFAALVVRGVLFALIADPYVVIAVQVLDGISAAVLGVMFPLVIADITRGTGHFSFALGIVGVTMGLGAALSTTLAGYLIDHFGRGTAFLGLTAIAASGFALVFLRMPETRLATTESDHGAQPEHVDERQPRCPFGLTDALVPNDELGHAFQRRYSGMQISKRRYAHQTLFFWRDKLGRLYMPRRSAPLSVEAAGLGEKEEATPDSDSWWRLLQSLASMRSWYTWR